MTTTYKLNSRTVAAAITVGTPSTSAKLTALMQSHIDRGRSTPGTGQKNEHSLSLSQPGETGQKRVKKDQKKTSKIPPKTQE